MPPDNDNERELPPGRSSSATPPSNTRTSQTAAAATAFAMTGLPSVRFFVMERSQLPPSWMPSSEASSLPEARRSTLTSTTASSGREATPSLLFFSLRQFISSGPDQVTPSTQTTGPSQADSRDQPFEMEFGMGNREEAVVTFEFHTEDNGPLDTLFPPLTQSLQESRRYNLRPRTRSSSNLGEQRRLSSRLQQERMQRLVLFMTALLQEQQHVHLSPPIASSDAKQALQKWQSLTAKQAENCSTCLICLEDFPSSESPDSNLTTASLNGIRGMPCKHLFHESCLFRWLETSNQCPTCRYELMTDNEDFNRSIQERMSLRQDFLNQQEIEEDVKDSKEAEESVATAEAKPIETLSLKRQLNIEQEPQERPTKRQRHENSCGDSSSSTSSSS